MRTSSFAALTLALGLMVGTAGPTTVSAQEATGTPPVEYRMEDAIDGIPDQPSLMVTGVLPPMFTEGHSVDMTVVANMCDPVCDEITEVFTYVDGAGNQYLDCAVIAPRFEVKDIIVPAFYSAVLVREDTRDTVNIEWRSLEQPLEGRYERGIVCHGDAPDNIRSLFASDEFDVSAFAESTDTAVSVRQPLAGVIVAETFEGECGSFPIREDLYQRPAIVEFTNEAGDTGVGMVLQDTTIVACGTIYISYPLPFTR